MMLLLLETWFGMKTDEQILHTFLTIDEVH